MKRVVCATGVLFLLASLSSSASAQQKPSGTKAEKPSAEEKSHDAAKKTSPMGAWMDEGGRGQVLKVWKTNPQPGRAEIILIRLSTAQLETFESHPVKFLNEPTHLFSKAVIGVADYCQALTTHHIEKKDQKMWILLADHNNFSDICGAAVPDIPMVDEATAATRLKKQADSATPPKSVPKK